MDANDEKIIYKLKVRVTLFREGYEDGHAFGRGIYSLLKGIQETGSLNQTSKDMGMAYSKAWRILKSCENEFDISLIERNGAKGSSLTETGTNFIKWYDEMETAANKAAKQVFDKYWN